MTLQSPRGPIWLEGGKGFNLGLIQLLLKWKFLPVRTSGVQSEDLLTGAHKAQRSWCKTQPRIRDNLPPSPSSCRASLVRHQDYWTPKHFVVVLSSSSSFFLFFRRDRGSTLAFYYSYYLDFLNESDESIAVSFPDYWDMITSPSASALKNSDIRVLWESSSSRNSSSASINKPFLHPSPPADPLRQANRLPIKVLKMLTARSGHILHPEYLQPLPSTPVSPIEVRRRFEILRSEFAVLRLSRCWFVSLPPHHHHQSV